MTPLRGPLLAGFATGVICFLQELGWWASGHDDLPFSVETCPLCELYLTTNLWAVNVADGEPA